MARIVRTGTVDPNNLEPYPGNARRGDIALIRESLRENGQYRALVVQESTGRVLAGNHTLLAAREEGITEVHVDYVDCTDDEARKIVLIDNKANDEAEYDKLALSTLLTELEGDYEGTGFSDEDLTKLLDSLEPGGGDAGGGAGAVMPRVTYGDVWLLGPHKLMCGNALEMDDLGLLMAGEEARLIVTSPPYNQKLDGFKASGMQKENPAWVERMAGAYEDSKPEPEYQDDQRTIMGNLSHVVTDDASCFYNHKIRYRDREVLSPFVWLHDLPEWAIRQEIIWDRQGSITLNARMFMPCDERIYWMTRGESFVFNDTPEIKAYSTVWDIAPRAEANISAPFPQELPARCIQAASLRGDIVLDPYCGSGTTLLAADALGRRGFGMEINPEYCDVIISRWESASGMKAVLDGE